jgi:hypothetical protein
VVRARVFLRGRGKFRYGGELEAADVEDVWRQVQGDARPFGRPLRSGDIVYIGDLYHELNPDGGWQMLAPGPKTERLYRLALIGKGGVTS